MRVVLRTYTDLVTAAQAVSVHKATPIQAIIAQEIRLMRIPALALRRDQEMHLCGEPPILLGMHISLHPPERPSTEKYVLT